MSFNQVNKAADLSSKRVITNFNLKDFERAFVKRNSTTHASSKARKKAQALLEIVSNEVKDARKFFKCESPNLGITTTEPSSFKKRLSGSEEVPVNFYEFYETAIKGRVLRKLEEEATGGSPEKLEATPELNLTEECCAEPPKTISTVDTDAEGEAEEKPTTRKPPRRRPATTNFALLG